MKNTINEDRKWRVLSHYEYLPDGSKLSALAGSGAGYKYRGSFVYSVDSSGNERLESVACDEGRISVTYSGSGAASYRDDWHVRDYLGLGQGEVQTDEYGRNQKDGEEPVRYPSERSHFKTKVRKLGI